MTRVCHLITGLRRDGAQLFLLRLLRELDPDRFQSLVISMSGEGDLGDEIREVAALETLEMTRAGGLLTSGGRLRRIVAKWEPDAVMTWLVHANVFGTLVLGRTIPSVWNIRNTPDPTRSLSQFHRLLRRAERRLSPRPQKIVFNSVAGLSEYERLGYSVGRARVIPNGVDVEAIREVTPDERAEARRRFELSADALVVGRAARYHPKKDFGTFLEAAAELAPSFPAARYLLAGEGVDEANAELRSLIEGLGLGSRVTLLGSLNEMRPFFAACDLVVSSSAWGEGFPNVIAEAMAHGVPCIATDVGDSALLLDDPARIVQPESAPALARATETLLTRPTNALASLGERDRAIIYRSYALPGSVRRYEQLLGAD